MARELFCIEGSRHILSQSDILARSSRSSAGHAFGVRRELQGYAIADRIAVPSTQVVESFAPFARACRQVVSQPLWRRPRSVSRCGQRTLPSEPTVAVCRTLVVSEGRGSSLVQAVQAMDGVRLIHVGPLVDAPFPNHPRFVHHEPVPQWELKRFLWSGPRVRTRVSSRRLLPWYSAKPSLAELPLVCTDRTGGSDLAMPGTEPFDPSGTGRRLRTRCVARSAEALDDAIGKTGVPSITETERQALGWRRYALQHLQLMNEMLQ